MFMKRHIHGYAVNKPLLVLMLVVLFLMLCQIRNAYGQWSETAVTATPVCTEPSDQSQPHLVSDGYAGAIVVWLDQRNGSTDIYAQRMNHFGEACWTEFGVPIIQMEGEQTDVCLAEDAAAGVIAVWTDQRFGFDGDVYGQRLNAEGEPLWPLEGLAIGKAPHFQGFPCIVKTGHTDSFMVAWQDRRRGVEEIFCQALDKEGHLLWEEALRLEPTDTLPQPPLLIPDGYGGAYLAWYEERFITSQMRGATGMYIQRIAKDGALVWDERFNLLPYPEERFKVWDFQLLPGNEHDAWLVWMHETAYPIPAYARVRADGEVVFSQLLPMMFDMDHIVAQTLPNGECLWAMRAWDHYIMHLDLMKIDKQGDPQLGETVQKTEHWTCTLELGDLAVLSDSTFVFAWHDSTLRCQRYGDIYTPMWQEPGPFVFEAPVSAQLTTDGGFGTIATFAWNHDIWAQRINGFGELGGTVVPVEWGECQVNAGNEHIELEWCTESERQNLGFILHRRFAETGDAFGKWETVGFVRGHGTTQTQHCYSHIDQHSTQPGLYEYQIQQLDLEGGSSWSP